VLAKNFVLNHPGWPSFWMVTSLFAAYKAGSLMLLLPAQAKDTFDGGHPTGNLRCCKRMKAVFKFAIEQECECLICGSTVNKCPTSGRLPACIPPSILVTFSLPFLPVLRSSIHCRLPAKQTKLGAPHFPHVHLHQSKMTMTVDHSRNHSGLSHRGYSGDRQSSTPKC
jgi:hypothetical protein